MTDEKQKEEITPMEALRRQSSHMMRQGFAMQDAQTIIAAGNAYATATCAVYLEEIRDGIVKLNERVDQGIELAMTFGPGLLSGSVAGGMGERFGKAVGGLFGKKGDSDGE